MQRSQIRDLAIEHTARDDKESIADAAIDLAFSRLSQMHTWQQGRLDQQFPLAIGDSFITLPLGTRSVIEIRMLDGIRSYPMVLEDKATVLRRVPNPPVMPPSRPYYLYRETDSAGNDNLYFVPLTVAAFTIDATIDFGATIGPEDDDESNIPDADEAVVAFATSYVFKSIGDTESAGLWEAQFNQAAARLILSDQDRPALSTQPELHPGVGERRGGLGRGYVSMDPQNDPFVPSWT